METGGRNRPPAEKTLENPARVPKVQGNAAESLRQKDGGIEKVILPFITVFSELPLFSRKLFFGGKKLCKR